MYWQVIIPDGGNDNLSKSITIEAENWFSALRSGLNKHGVDGIIVSNLSCNINPDESVTVSDFVARRVYQLKPVAPPEEPIPDETVEKKPSPLKGDFCPHKIFFSRDEAPEDGSGIYYRERLLAVETGYTQPEVSLLVHAYFEELKRLASPVGTKLFISIQVFDHHFDEQAQRPAVAALTWREWNPRKPKILFPLSGDESLTFSKLPAPPAPADTQKRDIEKPSLELVAEPEHTQEPSPTATDARPKAQAAPKSKKQKNNNVAQKIRSTSDARRPKKSKKKETVIEDKMVQAFESMQDIYDVRDHDGAAEFALTLARELIPCEAGSCMLTTPGQYNLYVAAAQGPAKDIIAQKRFSFTEGIIGFATRSSVVVNITDPENDPRFDSTVDAETGFKTNSILCSPIQIDGLAVGALELLNSKRSSGFNQEEANVLSYLGGALAEYITTSLPSREADFSDREFLEPFPRRPNNSGKRRIPKKAATGGAQKPAAKDTSPAKMNTMKTAPEKEAGVSTPRPKGPIETKPQGPAGSKPTGQGKSQKNKKRRRKKKK